MSHRLTIKGQVTIPKEIRDFLGLEDGNSCVEFAVEEDGSVTLRKASVEKPRAASRSHSTSVRAAVHPRCSQSARQGGVLALLAGGF
ncbi:MAG: AbrB/MazE/SpoVT family DNA-binding domain-containing protein [Sutterella sp.]